MIEVSESRLPALIAGAETEEYKAKHPPLGPLIEVGRELGYSIAVHGSLRRDLDLIAVPWTNEAQPATELIAAFVRLGYSVVRKTQPIVGKPHGRIGVNLQYDGARKVVDLSIILPIRRDCTALAQWLLVRAQTSQDGTVRLPVSEVHELVAALRLPQPLAQSGGEEKA